MQKGLESVFDSYKANLATLTGAMQKANNVVAQKKSDKAKTEAIDYANSEISVLNDSINLKVSKNEISSSINIEPQSVKIHTSKLLLSGDAGNKCQNPSFTDGDADWYGGIKVVTNIGNQSKYWGKTTANTYHFYGDEFNVTVGDVLYLGCHCKADSSGGNGGFDLGIRVTTSTGSQQFITVDRAYSTSISWIEKKVTIPEGATSARLYVYSKNSSIWYFTNVSLRNAVNTELIVDGAIKAKHMIADEFRSMYNTSSGMSRLDGNSLEFVDGNNAKFSSFKQEKLNFFNWNKGYISSLTRSHLAYPETNKEGTVQLSGQYGYFHDFGYNTSLANENYDITNTSYTPLMRIQYRQSNYDSPGVYIRNRPLFIDSSMSMRGKVLHLNDSSRNYIQENGGRFELSVSSGGQFVMGSNSGSGVNWHFEFTPNKNSFFMRKHLNFEWSGYIYNTSIQNTYSDVQSRSFKETSTMEGIHSQIRIPIKSKITDGSCKINIPSAFKDTMKDYIVTGLTKYCKGDIWVSREEKDYFIVESDSDMKFSLDLVIIKH